jgi:hypothetical protein
MYSNQHGSPVFEEFLECLGQRIKLNGFKGFRGGLDNKGDSTGTESIYTVFHQRNIMFHVSTFLPFSDVNPQQVQRKSHIGNDIGIIIFRDKEDSWKPFDPSIIVSQFSHFCIVVEYTGKDSSGTSIFRVSCSRKDNVPAFGPFPISSARMKLGESLRNFILLKCKNEFNQ